MRTYGTGSMIQEWGIQLYKRFYSYSTSCDGFMLIEALFAVAILSIAIIGVLQISRTSVSNHHQANNHTLAALEARSVLESIGKDIPLVVGTRQIQRERNKSVTIAVEPFQFVGTGSQDEEELQLFSVTIQVMQGGTQVGKSLKAIIYGGD